MRCHWYWGSHGCDLVGEHEVHICGYNDPEGLCSEMRVVEGPVPPSWTRVDTSHLVVAEVRFWFVSNGADVVGDWTGGWTAFHMAPMWAGS